MAEATLTGRLPILCPVCLAPLDVAKDVPTNSEIHCSSCGRDFEFHNALPDRGRRSTGEQLERLAVLRESLSGDKVVSFLKSWGVALAVLCIAFASWYDRDMDGPEFLLFFLATFLFTWIGSTILRHIWYDTLALSVVAMLIFEGIGVTRVVVGYLDGLREFNFMIMGMVIGGGVYFIRAQHMKKSGDDRGGSGCSGGSGCGGGCGSGCGGCGGCG